jgi:hypothetical protein
MKVIQGISRQQMQFISLDEMITADNAVRIIDAFVREAYKTFIFSFSATAVYPSLYFQKTKC